MTVGLDSLRVFLPDDGFAELVSEFVTRCGQGELSETLENLHCLYGDI